MKKNVHQLMLVFLTVVAAGIKGGAAQLIADRHFRTGVNVQNPERGQIIIDGVLQNTDVYGAPVWNLAQWSSKSSVIDIVPERLPDGALKLADAYKTVILGGTGTGAGDIILGVDAVNEYGGVYRKPGDSWPHLLAAQRISNPNGFFLGNTPWLSELSEVQLDMEVRLNRAEHIYTKGYSKNVHAAQFLLYFTIQNLQNNPRGPDYGNYYWFGIKIYDDREPYPGPSSSHDQGSGKLIYNRGISEFCDSGLQPGEWKRIAGDLLPHIKAGLQRAWELGYLTNSFDFADYKIGGMNIGWEVPGLSRVEMQIRNFGIQAYGAEFAKPYEFATDGKTDGWTAAGAGSEVTNHIWKLTVSNTAPQLTGPAMRLNSARYPQVVLRINSSGTGYSGRFLWKRAGDPVFDTNRSVRASISGGGFQNMVFNMSSHPEWNGEITQFQILPESVSTGDVLQIDHIRPVAGVSTLSKDVILKPAEQALFWESRPYRQYTLQQSSNLTEWTNIEECTDRITDNSFMQYLAPMTNRTQFFRLQISPGP